MSDETNESVDPDQAWEHNRRQVEKWLAGVQNIVDASPGGERSRSEIARALEVSFTLRFATNPQEVLSAPAFLAILATLYLYGDGPGVTDDQLPPMVTTDETGPENHRFGF